MGECLAATHEGRGGSGKPSAGTRQAFFFRPVLSGARIALTLALSGATVTSSATRNRAVPSAPLHAYAGIWAISHA
jgi:hypothetical protein